jgi:hypothetical protein
MTRRCESTTGWSPGDYGLEPVRCHQTIGIAYFIDRRGFIHAACAAHREAMAERYGTNPESVLGHGVTLRMPRQGGLGKEGAA